MTVIDVRSMPNFIELAEYRKKLSTKIFTYQNNVCRKAMPYVKSVPGFMLTLVYQKCVKQFLVIKAIIFQNILFL